MKEPKFKRTKRKLPHWTLDGSIYFVTFSLIKGVLTEKECQIVYKHIIEGHDKFYELMSFVVMPDHVHILFTLTDKYELSRVLKGIKGVSANLINKSRGQIGCLWLDESYDRIIRDEEELENALSYIENNPVKAGIVKNASEYPYYFFQLLPS